MAPGRLPGVDFRHRNRIPLPARVKSNQTLFVTCAEYNKCSGPYREMLTYKLLANSAVQEELRKYLPNEQIYFLFFK